ncbi:NAD-dependent epimerase/dehydratase family protein [Candidatus Pelagibacter sp.]|nr:NAD-dependent epimerase/dehydratase family protein [Candidatus Pelagibacter sp.]
MKNFLVVTGGAGFVGSNLIKHLIKNTKFKIISIDNYSSGKRYNHIKERRIKYIKGTTLNIENILKNYKTKIHTLFHFGEFSRIYQSFESLDTCLETNSISSNSVFKFCLKNKIKLVYSATSSSLGNKGFDRNLSPYSFTKSKNLELLDNLKKWFNFKFEVIYFYNVYGPGQISKGKMATVIGIFEDHYKNKKPLPVVMPGSQTRRFTHIEDSIETVYFAWKKNKCKHYAITSKKSWTILDVAKMFGGKIKYLPPRKGERYASALTKMSLTNKVVKRYGKKSLKDYIKSIVSK